MFRDKLRDNLTHLTQQARSASGAVELVAVHEDWIRDYIKIHVISLLYANLFYQALESAITTMVPEEAHWILDGLAISGDANRTVQANHRIWELAQLLQPQERESLEAGRIPTENTPFTARFRGFLAEYGQRASASWEIFSPRWNDQPEILAPLILAQTDGGPKERQQRQQQLREKAQKRMQQSLGWGPKRLAFNSLLQRTRKYLLLRENQRFWFDHLLYASQRNLLTLGRFLAARGDLKTPEDIAYLTIDEARGLAKGILNAKDAAEWVSRRRGQRTHALTSVPPVFLQGNDGVGLRLTTGRLEGLGISAGRVRGPVRLIHRLEDAGRLQPGDILVTRTVDPGWTPLFARAQGVVLELGSLLSHGAVVAREYGIPAVVNIDEVTSRLQDGQEVTIDGTRGLVWVHS